MRMSRWSSFSPKLLMAFLAVAVWANVGWLNTRDVPPQEAPPGNLVLDSVERGQYRNDLLDLLASPCDSIERDHNELHDCQRFIMRDSVPTSNGYTTFYRFGALIGIFPNQDVMALDADSFATARIAAYITNAGGDEHYPDAGYDALHVGPKLREGPDPYQYCLWLQRQDRDGRQSWRAAIVENSGYARERSVGCDRPPQEDDQWNLSVKRRTSLFPNASYPPTARWAWTRPGERDGQHYIEVRCGEGECAVTPDGVVLPDDLPTGNPRRTIPGWYDAQFLAVKGTLPSAPTDSILIPGPWAAVYPTMGPADPGPAPPEPQFAATVQVDPTGEIGLYRDKFKLNAAGRSNMMIQTFGTDPDRPDSAKAILGIGADTIVRNVSVGTGIKHGPHGSARWRWHNTDEGIWIPCYYWGCCEPEMGG